MPRAVLDSNSPTALADWIRRRSYKQNFPCVVVGDPQSGKSTLTLALALSIDPTFDLSRIAFTASQFMSLVNNPNLVRGNVIILEEAGVNISRAEWYSFINKAILFVAQTYGWKGLIVFFTLPSMGLLDSRVAKLLKGYIETIKMQRNDKKILFKFQTIETRKKIAIRGRELYYYRPVTYINNILTQVGWIMIDYPPENILKEYFKISTEYKEQLAASLEKESIKVDTITEPFNFENTINDVLVKRGIKDFLDDKNRWDKTKLQAIYRISPAKANVFVKLIEERMKQMGITIPQPIKSVKMKIFSNTLLENVANKKTKEEISGAKWSSST